MRYTYLFLILLMLPLAYSIEDSSYLSFRVGEQAQLLRVVGNHSDLLTSATCNVDIYNTNNDLVINDGVMSQTGRFYNYTYTFDTAGTWYAEYTCTVNSQTALYTEFISIQNTDIVNITTITEATHTNSRTAILLLEGSIRVYDYIWGNYTPRIVTSIINVTNVGTEVWDVNLSERYSQADDDNYVANSAGEKMLQSLRFIIQQVFGW